MIFKIVKITFIFLFSALGIAFSQLKESNITQKNLIENSLFFNSTNQNLRTEAVADSINPTVSIVLISGNNPRCNTDNQALVFSAVGNNFGNSPIIQWYVNTTFSATGSSFQISNLAHNDKVYCRLKSSLDCASPKNINSKSITISVVNTITSKVTISVLAGNNPDCTGNSPILLQAIPENCGQNPQFIWAFNSTILTTAVGSTFYIDKLDNKSQINVTVVSNIGDCISESSLPVTNFFQRKVQTALQQPENNAVDINLTSISNPDCSNKIYNFSVISPRSGTNPVYSWYLNNNLIKTIAGDVFNASTQTFQTSLPEIGDEIKVKVRSSLACIDTKEVTSPSYIRTDTIFNLPFFEDFSTYKGQPDVKKWLKNQGVYVANNYIFNPPSYGVAYFDGLKYNGNSYDSINVTARGTTDKLTSAPINLANYNNSDSLYLHFYWTVKGLGEEPDSTQGDRLALYLKDSNNNFVKKWEMNKFKTINKATFEHVSIKISSALGENFLHKGFQFKFETTGRMTGIFDIWGIDYIYIGRNSTRATPFFNDQTFGQELGSMLKNYSSMPYEHFIQNPDKELKDTIASTFLNNFAQLGNTNSMRFDIFENNTNVSLATASLTEIVNGIYPNSLKLFFLKSNITFLASAPTNPYFLTSTLTLRNDLDNSDGKGINYTQNNTISYQTRFDNYYAYDDGSAESVLSRNVKNGYVAMKFNTFNKDTLRQIAIQLNRSKTALTNRPISIMVWKKLPNLRNANPFDPDILYKSTHLLKYSNFVDGFSVINLDTRESPLVIVEGEFYIGYQQITDEEVIVGFDKNSVYPTSNLFYSDNGVWKDFSKENPESKGSMMMRPVFGNYTVPPLSIKKVDFKKADISVFPNPANEKIYFIESIEKVQIFDILGNKILTASNVQEIDTNEFQNGIYFLNIQSENQVFNKKIIIQH